MLLMALTAYPYGKVASLLESRLEPVFWPLKDRLEPGLQQRGPTFRGSLLFQVIRRADIRRPRSPGRRTTQTERG